MKSLKPQIVTVAGHVILPVDLTVAVSNVVTLITETNRRPTALRSLDVDSLREWREKALAFADDDKMSELVKLLQTQGKVPSPTSLFLEKYATVAASLAAEPRYEQDAGGNLRDQLVASGNWARHYVASPAMGYAREYVRLVTDLPALAMPFDLPAWPIRRTKRSSSDVESAQGGGEFRDALALLCQLLDRPALSDRLAPDQQALIDRNPKETFFGQARAALLQAERLTSAGLLWQRQADAFMLRVSESLWTACYNLAVALFPRERPVVEYYAKMRQAALAAVPCHPILETIANLFTNVTMQTIYGDKPVAIRHGRDPGARETSEQRASGPSAATLANAMVVHAAAEAGRMRSLTQAGETWPRRWVDDVAPDMTADRIGSALGGGAGVTSIGELMEWVSKNQQYTAHWSEIARQLGWSSPVGQRPIDIVSAGADFVLTDGDGYSADPASVLAGLRPALSMGNVRATGARIRFDADFGTGPDVTESLPAADGGEPQPVMFRWSTVAVKGHMSAVDAVHVFSRFYVPIGMLMGEAGAQIKFVAPDDTDHIGGAVQSFYREQSPAGYIRQWYDQPSNTLSRITPEGTYMRTSWDAFGESDKSARQAQALMLAGYGPANIDKAPLTVFAFREAWNMRVPAQLARANYFEWYDEIGAYRGNIAFSGTVVFDDDVSLTASADALMPYVDQLKVHAPAIDSPATKEVSAPEGPGAA